MSQTLVSLLLMMLPLSVVADDTMSSWDLNQPFGFVTRTSRTGTGDSYAYAVTGGGVKTPTETVPSGKTVITLTATDVTSDNVLKNAISNNDIVILDGKNGDFTISKQMSLSGLQNKTILGINNARLCTKWYLTDSDRAALDAANVKSASTSGGGGQLSNGKWVSEQGEYLTRSTLLGIYGNEDYQNAGVFGISGCENIIIRNLKFVGPGSVDVGGKDLISVLGQSKHIWIDHCEFTDGIDGNLDITNNTDFCTVSWCTFKYTDRSYMHQNTNLVGSSDDDGKNDDYVATYLNITFANNHWGEGCDQRMPMARSGKIHMMNNYYTCSNNKSSINARANSEFYIEGNYFADGVSVVFSQSGATAWNWVSSGTTANRIPSGKSVPSNEGTVTIPYIYTCNTTSDVPTQVGTYAGSTIFGSTQGGEIPSGGNEGEDGGSGESGEVTSGVIFMLVNTADQSVTIYAGQEIDLEDYATITGGSASITNKKGEMVTDMIGSKGFKISGSQSSYITINLNTPLKKGDVFTMTTNSWGDGGCIAYSRQDPEYDNISNQTYIFGSADEGKTSFNIYRGLGKPQIKSITITRPAALTLSAANGYTSFDEGLANVTITKTFPADAWTSLVLPFSVSESQLNDAMGEGTRVATLNKVANNTVHFTPLEPKFITANQPVLIKVASPASDNTYNFYAVTVANSSAAEATADGVKMCGVYKKTNYTALPENLYFVANGKFYDYSYLSYMSAFSAYIIPTTSSAKALSFTIDDEITGISQMENGECKMEKMAAYNLAGQRVNANAKGFVIINGKKILNK